MRKQVPQAQISSSVAFFTAKHMPRCQAIKHWNVTEHSHVTVTTEENNLGNLSSWDTGLTKYQAVQREALWLGGYLVISDIPDCYKHLKTSV